MDLNSAVMGLVVVLFAVVTARVLFVLGQRFPIRRHERETIAARLATKTCPECHEEIGNGEAVCPRCAHDITSFNQGHAAAARESLARRMVARGKLTTIEAFVLYAFFVSLAVGTIFVGFFTNSWVIIAAGVLALAIDGVFLWLDMRGGSRYTLAKRQPPSRAQARQPPGSRR
jgi:hypothetical protein